MCVICSSKLFILNFGLTFTLETDFILLNKALLLTTQQKSMGHVVTLEPVIKHQVLLELKFKKQL